MLQQINVKPYELRINERRVERMGGYRDGYENVR
jgi:hypothetical protein